MRPGRRAAEGSVLYDMEERMAEVAINVSRNGPYAVEVRDADGALCALPLRRIEDEALSATDAFND
jgi:hypothetical protein